jgi:hypothetical protein
MSRSAGWSLVLVMCWVLTQPGCHALRGLHHGIQRDIDHLSDRMDKLSDQMD